MYTILPSHSKFFVSQLILKVIKIFNYLPTSADGFHQNPGRKSLQRLSIEI